MFEGFKNILGPALDGLDKYRELKTTYKINNIVTAADAKQCFRYEPDELFTLRDIRDRYEQWEKENPDPTPEQRKIMASAYRRLTVKERYIHQPKTTKEEVALQKKQYEESLILWEEWESKNPRSEWKHFPSASQLFADLLYTDESASKRLEKFNQWFHRKQLGPLDSHTIFLSELNECFGTLAERCTSVEAAEHLDYAYRALLQTAYKDPDYDHLAWLSPCTPAVAQRLAEGEKKPASPVIAEPELVIDEGPSTTVEEPMNAISYEDALKCFGFSQHEDFTLDDVGTLFYQWKRENPDEPIDDNNIMQEAYRILSKEKIFDAWETVPSSSMNIYEALKVFGEINPDIGRLEKFGFVSSNYQINKKFEISAFSCSTLERATQLDQAYRVIWEYPFQSQKRFPSVSMKPPFSPLFKKIFDSKAAAGWNVSPYTESSIPAEEAKAMFNLNGATIYVTPEDITLTFRNLQHTCTTIEAAQKLDIAYSYLFEKYTFSREYYSGPIDAPFAPALAQKLAALEPVEAIAEVPTLSEIAEVETPQPQEPVSLEMTQKEARVFLNFGRTDIFTPEDLDARYEQISADNDSKVLQIDIDTAYQVLKAHLKSKNKGLYARELALFGYGKTETFTREDLDDRYTRLSKDTDSKAKQKALDDAYAVLITIAA